MNRLLNFYFLPFLIQIDDDEGIIAESGIWICVQKVEQKCWKMLKTKNL